MGKVLFRNRLNGELCLIIGMADSPHLHAWIRGMEEAGVFKNIVIFPSDFPRTLRSTWFNPTRRSTTRVRVIKLLPLRILNFYLMHLLEVAFGTKWRSIIIWFLIRTKKPCVVHYHEMQHGGYLLNTLSEKIESLGDRKPKIIGSTWGSDLAFFGYIESHKGKIQNILDLTSVLTAERSDEIEILREFNYRGDFLAPVYISVGNQTKEILTGTKPESRDIILIRGYQHDQGRALNALKALEGLEAINKFKIKIFSATKSPSVILQSSRLKRLFGYDIEVLPKLSHAEFLKIFSKSRIYIGLSETDGLSTSMVEAMASGCFPIQSSNSAAPYFIEHGVTGFVVEPWDISGIRESIRISLTDDKLLEAAQIANRNVIADNYNWDEGVKNIAKLYNFRSDSISGALDGLF